MTNDSNEHGALDSNETPMGATLVNSDSVCTFKVWAPHADSVYVTGSFNEWDDDQGIELFNHEGFWLASAEGVSEGDEYRYVIRNGNKTFSRVDPHARCVTNSVGNSVIYKDSFDWGKDNYALPSHNKIVIYELHVGSFTMKDEGCPGTLDDLADKLNYLSELGVNVIQLMPIAEFAGDLSWGYNPAHVFAIESAYGGPDALKRFVKAAHEQGIGVIIDVVYNHFGPSDLSLWQFDGWSENDKGGIYFYNDHRSDTPWGDTRPDYGRIEVQNFILDNVRMWFTEYHVDGLRLDMTAFMRSINGDVSDRGSEIKEAWKLCQKINKLAHELKPNALMIAEDLQGEPAVTQSYDGGGAGFDAQWDKFFVHPVRQILLEMNDENRNMDDLCSALTANYNGNAFSRIVYTESHDEVANGKSRMPSEISFDASDFFSRKKSTLGTSLMLSCAGVPMLFQGQEFLEDGWFQDTRPLSWDKADRFPGILQMHRDLISLRINKFNDNDALTGSRTEILKVDNKLKLVSLVRRTDEGDTMLMAYNLSANPIQDYTLEVPGFGDAASIRFNSDARIYDQDFGDVGSVAANRDSVTVSIGAYACLAVSPV